MTLIIINTNTNNHNIKANFKATSLLSSSILGVWKFSLCQET